MTLFLRVTNKAIKPKIPFNGGMIMSNINNCCHDTTEIRLTVDQFIVLIFKLHESRLHLNGFNRIALESLAKELQRKLFKAIHLRYEWFRPVEAKLLNESFKSDTNKVTKETATFTIPTLLKASIGLQLDEDTSAYKQFLNKLLPYEKEWLIKDLRDVFLATTGVYCLIYIISAILNGSQILSSFNFLTLFAFSSFSTLLCFPILYLLLFKLRSIRTPKLFKLEGNIRTWRSAISKELATLKEDSVEDHNEKIFELINTNISTNCKKNKNEEKNLKRFLYVTTIYFSEAMHYAHKQKTGKSEYGISVLTKDIETLMNNLNVKYETSVWGTSGKSNLNNLISIARDSVKKENGYNLEDEVYDDHFSSHVRALIEEKPNQYNLIRSISPKH